MTWLMWWLNKNIATLNFTSQFLDISKGFGRTSFTISSTLIYYEKNDPRAYNSISMSWGAH